MRFLVLVAFVTFLYVGQCQFLDTKAPLQLGTFQRISRERSQLKSPIQKAGGGSRATALPENVVPKSYNLKIRPILDPNDATGEQWTAPGHIDIEVVPILSTSQIVFHRDATLTIHEATAVVTSENGSRIPILNHTFAPADMFHTINLGGSLVGRATYKISLDFTAPISPTTKGLYRAEYKDEAGNEYRLAATQFEYSNARQAFPCFDEPRWKTPFTVSLGYKNDTYKTLGNSVKSVTAEPDPTLPNWVWDHFNTTIKLPTYLIAIVISNFDYLDAPEPVFKGRPVRIYGEPRYISPEGDKAGGGAKFAANASAHILAFLEKKYVFPYEMPKMDSVAIPNPFFGPGAMENSGLNIYKENYLLFWEGEQSWADKQEITSILSHELAHQWFGNLVTCKTWANLWLNEGFANYVQNFGVEELHPEFDELRARLTSQVHNAMDSDVTGSVPIQTEGAPGTIVYDKGSSIIRMMEGFLGEDTLNTGIINYLIAQSHETAVQDDLFDHLTTQAILDQKLPEGKTVKDIMDTWTLQAGFPLIRVSKVGSERVYISQERFQPANSGTAALYEVPISTATPDSATFSNHTPAIWLNKTTVSKSYPHDTSKWLIINPDAMAYYRVLYDEEMTQLILNQLKAKRAAISGLSRSQLIDDYFSCATYGHISWSRALEFLTVLKNDEGIEMDFLVWTTVFNRLAKALTIFQAYNGGPNHSLGKFLLPKLELALNNVGWTQGATDQGARVLFRAKLLDWACALESSECTATAQAEMQQWENSTVNPIPVDVQPMMYCAYVAAGDRAEFNWIQTQFKASPIGTFKSHRSKLLNALSCTKVSLLLDNLLSQTIDPTNPIGQSPTHSLSVLQNVAGNPLGRRKVFPFLISNFDKVNGTLGGVAEVGKVLKTLAGYVTDGTDLNHFKEQFETPDLFPIWGSMWLDLLNTINENAAWVQDHHMDMDDWFGANF